MGQFVLSCRSFGRGVETVILGELVKQCSAEWLQGRFKRTKKNEPAQRFLAGLGCDVISNNQWRLKSEAVEIAASQILEQTGMKVLPA